MVVLLVFEVFHKIVAGHCLCAT